MEQETITWKEEYSVGLTTVDKQHQKFLTILNELGTCIAEGSYKENGKSIFFALLHFADEYLLKEKMLVNSVSDIDYSHFREKHKQFLAKLQLFKNEYNESASEQLFVDLYEYLKQIYPKYISYYTPSLIKILKTYGIK
jgi:hemerythrin